MQDEVTIKCTSASKDEKLLSNINFSSFDDYDSIPTKLTSLKSSPKFKMWDDWQTKYNEINSKFPVITPVQKKSKYSLTDNSTICGFTKTDVTHIKNGSLLIRCTSDKQKLYVMILLCRFLNLSYKLTGKSRISFSKLISKNPNVKDYPHVGLMKTKEYQFVDGFPESTDASGIHKIVNALDFIQRIRVNLKELNNKIIKNNATDIVPVKNNTQITFPYKYVGD